MKLPCTTIFFFRIRKIFYVQLLSAKLFSKLYFCVFMVLLVAVVAVVAVIAVVAAGHLQTFLVTKLFGDKEIFSRVPPEGKSSTEILIKSFSLN